MRVVDIHAHLYPRAYLDLLGRVIANDSTPWGRAVGFLLEQRFLPNRAMWDIDAHIEDMDKAGVEVQVLSLSTPMCYFQDENDAVEAARITNDSLAEVCARYPSRFKAMASVPLAHTDASLRELDRAIGTLGLHGVGLGANAHSVHLDDERVLPLFSEINRRKLTVFLHPAIPPGLEEMLDYELWVLAGFLMDSALATLRLANRGVFAENPDMNFIVPHLGTFLLSGIDRVAGSRPAAGSGCREDAQRLPEGPLLRFGQLAPTVWDCAIGTVGKDHVLFGTDYPFGAPDSVARGIQRVNALQVGDSEKEAIFSATADRLLK